MGSDVTVKVGTFTVGLLVDFTEGLDVIGAAEGG